MKVVSHVTWDGMDGPQFAVFFMGPSRAGWVWWWQSCVYPLRLCPRLSSPTLSLFATSLSFFFFFLFWVLYSKDLEGSVKYVRSYEEGRGVGSYF